MLQLYFGNLNRASSFLSFNDFVTGGECRVSSQSCCSLRLLQWALRVSDPNSLETSREFFNKLIPISEEALRDLCIYKSIQYQAARSKQLKNFCSRCCRNCNCKEDSGMPRFCINDHQSPTACNVVQSRICS
jgi:hypothetical protein